LCTSRWIGLARVPPVTWIAVPAVPADDCLISRCERRADQVSTAPVCATYGTSNAVVLAGATTTASVAALFAVRRYTGDGTVIGK